MGYGYSYDYMCWDDWSWTYYSCDYDTYYGYDDWYWCYDSWYGDYECSYDEYWYGYSYDYMCWDYWSWTYYSCDYDSYYYDDYYYDDWSWWAKNKNGVQTETEGKKEPEYAYASYGHLAKKAEKTQEPEYAYASYGHFAKDKTSNEMFGGSYEVSDCMTWFNPTPCLAKKAALAKKSTNADKDYWSAFANMDQGYNGGHSTSSTFGGFAKKAQKAEKKTADKKAGPAPHPKMMAKKATAAKTADKKAGPAPHAKMMAKRNASKKIHEPTKFAKKAKAPTNKLVKKALSKNMKAQKKIK